MVASFTLPATAQTTALLEDFEDAAVTYTTSPAAAEFNDGGGDFFTRTNGSTISSDYAVSGISGTSYFAAQDLDGDSEAGTQSLVFSGIDISGLADLVFSASFTEDDALDGNEDWDSSDELVVYASIDGGAEVPIFGLQNDGSAFNSAPFVDSDGDGTADGPEITSAFATYSATIPGSGTTLDLRIEISLNAGDEDVAIDDVSVTGVRGAEITLSTFVAQADVACTDPEDIETCTVPESSSTMAEAGEKVIVRYWVENTGDVTLTTHDLVDTEEGLILNNITFDLTPGLIVFLDVFGTAPATLGTATRGATWTADDGGSAVAIGTSTYEITVAPPPTACTTTAPLYISAFATGSPGSTTVTNSSATDTVDLPDCTLAVFDGISELVSDVETAPAPLAPGAAYPFTPDLPMGPGAIIVSTASLGVGNGVSDAMGTVVAAVVYDGSGTVFGECGRGPEGAQGGALAPCDSEVGTAAVAAALAALFGGAVASDAGESFDWAVSVAPNPVARHATIAYSVPAATDVRLSVIDALGREVAVLARGPHPAGEHEAAVRTAGYPTGVYVVRMIAGDAVRTVPITVVR